MELSVYLDKLVGGSGLNAGCNYGRDAGAGGVVAWAKTALEPGEGTVKQILEKRLGTFTDCNYRHTWGKP